MRRKFKQAGSENTGSQNVYYIVKVSELKKQAITFNKVLFLFTVLALVLSSCRSPMADSNENVAPKDTMLISEGVVIYEISYPNLTNDKLSAFLPQEISFVFKGNLSSYIIRSGLGTVKIVRLLDYDKQEFISLLINTWGTNYACQESPEEIRTKETSRIYRYEFIDSTRVIDGLSCKKAMVKVADTDSVFAIYYAPSIPVHNWNSPYNGLNKLLVSYPFRENGMDMLLQMKSIEPKNIDSSYFGVRGEFEWVSASEFNQQLEELQN